MHLNDEDIRQFQELYKQRYGKEISKEKAYEQGLKLLILLKRIYRPMTTKQFDDIQEHRAEMLLKMIPEILRRDREDGIRDN